MAKGSEFERWFCRQLSLWWTGGKSDSTFWRTSNSGGRATVRGKKGKRTKNHYGDVMAVEPEGQPFIDAVTVELKRGYNRVTIQDLLDKPKGAAKQEWEKWIKQAQKSAKDAGSESWLLVVKRDRRESLACYPADSSFPFVMTGAACIILQLEDPDETDGELEVLIQPLRSVLDGMVPWGW